MYHIFSIHSSVKGHLGCFQLLAIINKAAISIVAYVPLLYVGTSFGSMCGITLSSNKTISNFHRKHQITFQSGFTHWQSHQQWRSIPLSPHPSQPLLSLEVLILAIMIGKSRISGSFWNAFPRSLGMLNISWGAYHPSEFLSWEDGLWDFRRGNQETEQHLKYKKEYI